jgi:16S rRNA (cytosine967-C5)-methyltransferase
VGLNEPANTGNGTGLASREAVVRTLESVLYERCFLDDALDRHTSDVPDQRDRAFVHLLAATCLRRKGQIEQILARYMDRPLERKAGRAKLILLAGAAQILFLETSPHAAISTSVGLAANDRSSARYKSLVNALLHRICDDREALLADLPPALSNLPHWLNKKLRADLGEKTAVACAQAHLMQSDLDLTVADASHTGELEAAGGQQLPTGSVRFAAPYPAIPSLPGYQEGHWWVQDAAAALPARLLGDVAGKRVLDMCAAPGGKTLQLAAMGAQVTALDVSEARLEKVQENLDRTGLSAICIAHDALSFEPEEPFDSILLDAPCSATGTIRRHPELPWIRREDDLGALVRQQRELLRHAATLLKPGGQLVYAVCSLLAEEGAKQVQAFLNENRQFTRVTIDPGQLGIADDFITRRGDLRTLPSMAIGAAERMDGFYAAHLQQRAN